MTRPVSLSVHRNNRAQREAKRVRAMLKADVKSIATIRNIAGYAVVAWDKDRGYLADWYAPLEGPIPGATMPDYVKVSLQREIIKGDTLHIVDPDDGSA